VSCLYGNFMHSRHLSISYWDKQRKICEISLYLYNGVEKKSVLEKLSTLAYGLHIYWYNWDACHGKLEVCESKWMF